ncbi:hypothetical protein MML48_3g00020456 [Holotrichia oblita]|nr:hypothetical protein MML48_3g00020456 [Holotrichia oblita]
MNRCTNPDAPVKITSLPYYGGAYGQVLEIHETADGRVSTQIVAKPTSSTSSHPLQDDIKNYTALEFPELPSKYDSEYSYNIKNLHHSALNIIQLQENAKQRGSLTEDEKASYDRNTRVLNKAAKDLAELQLSDDDDDIADDEGLREWFEKRRIESRKQKPKEEDKKKGNQNKVPNKKEEEKEKEKEKEKPEKEEEEEGEEDDSDSVIINLPPDEASVAEAKPVGLAIAG